LGLRPGEVVVIMLVTHRHLPAAFLGAMWAGLIPTLFPPMSPKQDPKLFWHTQSQAFEHLDASLIVGTKATNLQIQHYLRGFATRTLDVDDPLTDGHERVSPVLSTDGTAFLQHSSGTTGMKKGIVLAHSAVIGSVIALGTALNVTDNDIIVSWLPLYHDMGLTCCLVTPMMLGITAVQIDPFDWVSRPTLLLDYIEAHRATLCWLPNFAYHHIARNAGQQRIWDLSSLRALIDAAEPCKPDTLRHFGQRFASSGLAPNALQVGYGMAENVCIATQTDFGKQPRYKIAAMDAFITQQTIKPPAAGEAEIEFVSVGRAIPGTTLRIEAPDGTILPEGRVGEIALTSPYLFKGYFREDRPTEKLRDGWYRSGDLGFLDDGELFVCGRVDDLLIVNGKNLYAHDVEFSVNRVPGVKPGRAVAVAPFSPRTGSQVLIIIAETETIEKELRLQLRRAVQAQIQSDFGMAAHDVLINDVGWLIKTTSGKIARGANEQRYVAQFPAVLAG
jgi:fatty-acyl-CoA synthase